ncbi:MAG: hypothetical protein ACR2KG_11600 [Nocardioidaceae bacterium]
MTDQTKAQPETDAEAGNRWLLEALRQSRAETRKPDETPDEKETN